MLHRIFFSRDISRTRVKTRINSWSLFLFYRSLPRGQTGQTSNTVFRHSLQTSLGKCSTAFSFLAHTFNCIFPSEEMEHSISTSSVLLSDIISSGNHLPHHKETIILIRKISVLWLFYCQNGGVLPFFINFITKMKACRDVFCPCKLFCFYP